MSESVAENTPENTPQKPGSDRVVSLDQFRGFTVLGMAFVNFLGGYLNIHPVFGHHHTYFSYADAIMPQFFFAVGFAYRLTFLKNLERYGIGPALGRVMRRCLGLFLIGMVVHQLTGSVKSWDELTRLVQSPIDFLERTCKRSLFQTLVHISVTSLWVLPVIGLGIGPRVAFAAFSGALHLGLSFWFNYQWVLSPPVGIDGGPLGFLTWTIPLLAGSIAFDWTRSNQPGSIPRLLGWGGLLMAGGYGLSCLNLFFPPNDGSRWFMEPPFFPPATKETINIWTMSQRAGSLTYLLFAAGFAMATYSLFVFLCDRLKWSWSFLATLGGNALVAYILLGMLEDLLHPFTPKDSPAWYALLAWLVEVSLCWLFLRSLEKNGVRIRM